MKTETKSKVTPRPWSLDVMGYMRGPNNENVLEEKANANYCVRAVNCYEELLETIRWMAQTVHQGNHLDQPGTFRECPKNVCDAAKQAIVKAEAL